MSRILSLLVYNLLLPLGLLFMLPSAIVKMRRRGGKWSDLLQRFSLLGEAKLAALARLPAGSRRLWMHAVSVGEVGIATKLIARLLQEQPETGIVLTTTTPTGHALAEDFAKRHPDRLVVLYSPLDLPVVAGRMLRLLKPAQIVLVEAEVWPNLVAAARRRRIPVSLVNARLSPRSERRFQKFGLLIKPIFAQLKQVMVQEVEDVQRWRNLGVAEERILHTGSIKFDPQGVALTESELVPLRAVLDLADITPEQPILLAASTHAGEEALMAQVFVRLQEVYPELAFLVVPRHVERAADIVSELEALGLRPQRRSAVQGATNCLIIDTTGELRAWQSLATIVVVGKSFLAEGGQNPAEAVMAQKPVLFGPHMENFEALVTLLLAHQGAIQVPMFAALEQELNGLLRDPAKRDALGQAGHAALALHEGATARTAHQLLALGR